MMKFIDEDEALAYKVRKTKSHLFVAVFFSAIWLYFGYLFLASGFSALFAGSTVDFKQENYVECMVGLCVLISVVEIILLSYLLNRVTITNQRVYIQKGVLGVRYVIDLKDIRSFQHAYSRGKNGTITNDSICFYLNCGICIRTGILYATMGSLQELLVLLRDKFEGRGFSNQELKQMREEAGGECGVIRGRNVLALGILLAPFLLAIMLTIYYYGFLK